MTRRPRALVPVFMRADGRSPFWMFRPVDPLTGRRTLVSTKRTSRAEAEAVAAEWMRQRLDRKQLGKREETTLAEALARYIALDPSRATNCRLRALARKVVGDVSGAAVGIPGNTPLHALTSAMLARLHAQRVAEGFSPRTIKYETGLVTAAVARAGEAGFAVPASLTAPKVRLRSKRHYLTREEVEALLTHLHPARFLPQRGGASAPPPVGSRIHAQRTAAHDLTLCFVLTGARWSELARLTWPQVDLTAGSLRLWGKGGKERSVTMPSLVRDIVLRRLGDRVPGDTWVFSNGRRPIGYSRAIGRAMDALGFNSPERVERYGRCTIHSLRHTHASWLIQNRMGLSEVQAILGHSSPAQTAVYAHLAPDLTQARALAVLDSLSSAMVDALRRDRAPALPAPAEEVE